MEAFLDSLMQHWPGVLFRQRPDLSFEFAGPRLVELTGHPVEKWQSQPGLFWDVLHELDVEEVKKHLGRAGEGGEGVMADFRLRHAATGRVAYVTEFRRAQRDAAGRVVCYEGYWLDVTRQTLSERRLATAAWKETVGLVTLGLAHDFNNVLAGILGLSESYLSQIDPNHPFHEGLVLVKKNTQQAAQLIQRIAELHRGRTGTRSYQNLNDVVKDAAELLRKVVPRRIELATHLEAAQLPLYVDTVELRQVLINLALNAADAMPERGTLTLRTSQHGALPAVEHCVGSLPSAPVACLEVVDTGFGIKPRLLPFIFDPFFTTKPMNRGSGLGLYNARLFAEKHRGAISVESAEGAGTTFRVWLPLADFTEADRALEQYSRRRRSILLVGQPGRQIESTAEFLRQHNYHVVKGGLDAEDLLRSSDYVFDGVMLLTEPQDPQAATLARWVRQQKLPVKVILKTVGCNPDELDPQLFGKADLVIASDFPEDVILDKLAATFDLRGGEDRR
jgi:signal transduction histidine kinase